MDLISECNTSQTYSVQMLIGYDDPQAKAKVRFDVMKDSGDIYLDKVSVGGGDILECLNIETRVKLIDEISAMKGKGDES
jgi:hypothetical protein